MLRVDVRELRRGPVGISAELPVGWPELAGTDLELAAPVRVEGILQGAPERRTFRWQGRISTRVGVECRRCLVPVEVAIDAEVEVVFTPDPDAADDPGVYPLEAAGTEIDLAPAVREELLLAVPAFVSCREECAGLCQRCGADLNSGPCGCAPAAEPA
jgi:uncharacterized protein